ncbi:MAG: endonuclease/exonuclease/phosphatase family protein [Anaerolineaceae bacterium]|nr:endonuclease/exonuclease/phosphatase family protein [Anaerolineaceae bacterium]
MKKRIYSAFFAGLAFLLVFTSCQYAKRFWQPVAPILQPGLATLPSANPNLPAPSLAVPNSASLKIGQIQGKAHRSPYDGQIVRDIRGVVTALRGDGFFMQDPEPDNDPETSDGVFVKASGQCSPAAGSLVLLPEAKVREFNPAGVGENSLTITNLVASRCEVLEKAFALPKPIIIGQGGRIPPDKIIENDTNGYVSRDNLYDPAEDGLDFYESLEGMLVQVVDALTVSTRNGYRNIAVVGDGGRFASVLSSEGVLVIREGDFNPERLLLDDDFIVMPNLYVGTRFKEPIIGIIDYNFGEYNLEPVKRLIYEANTPVFAKVEQPATEKQISVVSYNVENLDPVAYPERLKKLAAEIVNQLASPDIIALQEVQDNDGVMNSSVTSANETLKGIVDAIKLAGGPAYRYVNIDPLDDADGGVPGGNIRPVILYRADKGILLAGGSPARSDQPLSVRGEAGKAWLSNNPGRVGIGSYYFRDSRKPLIVQFNYQGKSFFVINCHLKSKREDGPLYGEMQPPPLETLRQRNGQAELLAKTVSQILSYEANARVILLGDLNEFPWGEPLKKLESSPLYNLIKRLPENEHFTYSHSGMGQVLDHILVSPSLLEKVEDFKVIHLNSIQLPDRQLSDHDPVYALLRWAE